MSTIDVQISPPSADQVSMTPVPTATGYGGDDSVDLAVATEIPARCANHGGPDKTSETRQAIYKYALALNICLVVVYIFLVPVQNLDSGRPTWVKIITVSVWMLSTVLLFLCNSGHFIWHKGQMISAFLIAVFALHHLIGAASSNGLTDGMGVVMVSAVVAILSPKMCEGQAQVADSGWQSLRNGNIGSV
ncbi:hypothetical protein QBC47DRAFT_388096 [Echria macrotheca]|uniref:Uncharacterized protein n=1 Tax=Echria macrotheca TaxID=438768 RepID=A0AAJ0F4D7_9PEZI|nr:hypothetical protein QBC47DRAFT_388096 [Echria macrotheca]